MENYNAEIEKKLIEAVKEKEIADKRMLNVEVFVGVISTVILFAFVFLGAFLQVDTWLRIVFIVLGFALGITGFMVALRIEQVAGYYECEHCHHRYIPSFKSTIMAQHMARTRYMKCPSCQKKSWQKKVITKK